MLIISGFQIHLAMVSSVQRCGLYRGSAYEQWYRETERNPEIPVP